MKKVDILKVYDDFIITIDILTETIEAATESIQRLSDELKKIEQDKQVGPSEHKGQQ